MVEKARRTGGESAPRAADGRRFEVFIREEETDPLHHVGTVAAPTPDDAHDEASRLFAWYARDVWICPSEETHRYSTEALAADEGEGEDSEADGVEADGGETADSAKSAEPRVYEETEGSPEVTAGGPSSSERGQTEEGTKTGGGDRTETDR